MSETRTPLDLSALESEYEIVGELNTRTDARVFIATRKDATNKRRDDHAGVIITVTSPPQGDERNALSHFAADTQLLARLKHRRLVPVVEGRWVDKDSFAVVTERTGDTSLAEVLAHGERFSNPRAAAILREINGLLEWARGQRIIHRMITPETVFLEPGTDRVRAAFVVSPIPRANHVGADADADARTLGRLAVAMLASGSENAASTVEALETARPDLPERVIQATRTLLDDKVSGAGENVAGFLALVGMADPIAAGETEVGRIRAETLEEQRAEREKLAAERAHFEKTMADDRGRFVTERAELQRAIEQERARLLRAVEEERADLMAKQRDLEREMTVRRAELETAAAEDRRLLDDLREQLRRAGELEVEKKRQATLDQIAADEKTDSVLDQAELVPPLFMLPPSTPLDALEFDEVSPALLGHAVNSEALSDTAGTLRSERADDSVPLATAANRRWKLAPLVLVAAAVLVAVGFMVRNQHAASSPATVAGPTVARVPVVNVGAPPVGNPATAIGTVQMDSTRDTASGSMSVLPRTDSALAADSVARRDSVRAARAARQARVRRDSLARLDSARRDTLARPDTATAVIRSRPVRR